jgi:hypothetical protein
MFWKTLQIGLILCVLFYIGCGAKNKPPEIADEKIDSVVEVEQLQKEPVASEEINLSEDEARYQMQNLFPKDGAISGWQISGSVSLFDESDLFEHINGAAEAFFAYDFKLCGAAEYVPKDEAGKTTASPEDKFILIDAYYMGRPINAFGMYASERYLGSETVRIGTQGYVESTALNFWKGPYYIKISASSTDEDVLKANKELAEYIAQQVPGQAKLPAMLSLLPDDGLVVGTERFILSNILGYSFLKNGVTADYQIGDETKSLLIIQGESVYEAEDIFGKFTSYERETGENLAEIADLGEEAFTVKDKYYKRLLVTRYGKHLIVTLGIEDESSARSLIRSALENIAK